MGKIKRDFQDTGYVLRLFDKKVSDARKACRAYVKKGISQGRRPELVGGGLTRSAGGWSVVKAMRRVQDHMKSDERILGDGDFTQSVLDEVEERLEERYRFRKQGYDLETITMRVSSELGVDPEQVWACGKQPITAKARSLMCYWAVRKLGFSATELSKKLGVSQPSVSISVRRGEQIAKSMKIEPIKKIENYFFMGVPNRYFLCKITVQSIFSDPRRRDLRLVQRTGISGLGEMPNPMQKHQT